MIIGFSRAGAAAPSVVPPSLTWQFPLSVVPDRPIKRLMPNLTVRNDAGWMLTADVAGCPTSAAFLARTSGLDAAHIAAYNDLICGLVSDGIWTKLDALYILATQDSTTALLNLISTSYTATTGGAPTFTVDRGFTGVAASNTVLINTHFAPSYTTEQFQLNAAHISVWSVFDVAPNADSAAIGGTDAAGVFYNTTLNPRFSDGKFYGRVNSLPSSAGAGVAVADTIGHFLASRTSSSNIFGYKNGANVLTATSTSAQAPNTYYALGYDRGATVQGSAYQLAMVSIGGDISGADATNFYNRLRTYMTAVGVP